MQSSQVRGGSFTVLAEFVIGIAIVQVGNCQRFAISELSKQSKVPLPRMKFGLHSSGQIAVLFGGLGASGALSDTWIYNASMNMWEEVHPQQQNRPSPRYDFASSILKLDPDSDDSYMVIVGGRNDTAILTTSMVWTFHTETKAWAEVLFDDSSELDVVQGLARATSCGGGTNDMSMIISHGLGGPGVKSDALELVFETPTKAFVHRLYSPISLFAVGDPHPLYNASSVVTPANELVVYGGCYANGLCPNRDAWSFDIANRQWRMIGRGLRPKKSSAMAAGLRSFHLLGVDPRQSVIVWGGHVGRAQSSRTTVSKAYGLEVSILDVRTGRWLHEEVHGDEQNISSRVGAAIAPLRSSRGEQYYLIFGGVVDDGSNRLADSMLLLSFNSSLAPKEQKSKGELFFSNLITHAVFMFIAFGLLFPVGILGSRYVKLFGSPVWFHLHWICQFVGFLCAWIGTIFSVLKEPREGSRFHAHSGIGISIMVLISVQILAALPGVRPRPDAGQARTVWRGFHRCTGYVAFVESSINILLGLLLVVAPVAVWIFWCSTVAVVVGIGIPVLEMAKSRQTCHKDTRYKAFNGDHVLDSSLQRQRGEQSSSWISGLSTLYF